MQTSKEGIDLICHFEGWSSEVYLCPAKIPTRGYGFIRDMHGNRLTVDSGSITEAEGKEQLTHELIAFEDSVERLVNKVPLQQCQFDSLVSFTFNLGSGALQSSTLRRKLNRGNYDGAQREFRKWVYAGGRRLRGLVLRRAAEAELFSRA